MRGTIEVALFALAKQFLANETPRLRTCPIYDEIVHRVARSCFPVPNRASGCGLCDDLLMVAASHAGVGQYFFVYVNGYAALITVELWYRDCFEFLATRLLRNNIFRAPQALPPSK